MNRKKIIIISIMMLLVFGIPFIVFSNTDRPLVFKDGILIVKAREEVPDIPSQIPMAIETEYKSPEQIEKEQKELQQKLKEQNIKDATRRLKEGGVEEIDNSESWIKEKERMAKEEEEAIRKNQIFMDVMIRIYGKERLEQLEKLDGKQNTESNEMIQSTQASILKSTIEWYKLVADVVEFENISDEERDILKYNLEMFWQNSRKAMPTELRVRIQNILEMSKDRIEAGMR